MTLYHDHYEKAAKDIINHVGNIIVIGVPLGIGKPIGLLNALYRIAVNDQSLSLTIITGLTLSRPKAKNEIENRFLEPILDRLLQDYEDPAYEKARKQQQLPANVKVLEFFLAPGQYLNNHYVQQNYISSCYQNVIKDTWFYSMNVLAQQVAVSNVNEKSYSLSCNTDSFHQAVDYLLKKQSEHKNIAIVAEVNGNLPFMPGKDAVVNADVFTDIVDTGKYRALFAIPREELSTVDHLIGVYASCLIKDGSCIQIGIGKLNIAIANALTMRQHKNILYRDLLKQLSVVDKYAETLTSNGAADVFANGLYASTEMLSDDYLYLFKEGIIKKSVYDHAGLQRLLNEGKITEQVTPEMVIVLLDNNLINTKLTAADMRFLQEFGVFKANLSYQEGEIVLSGEKFAADLSLNKQQIMEKCLGDRLKTGKMIHAGFFLGSVGFYQQLRELSSAQLQQISMTSVARTNTLSWSYELARLQRQNARFVNFAMMVTLSGEVVSDGLKNLQEISGVGGQFDFVNMAHGLDDARSIIACRSVRNTKRGIESNIVWDYPNLTIPRYLRDIVITEYGIADCRSKTDAEVIKAILNITDSRFQRGLLAKAKKYGKVAQDYEIPAIFCHNYPDKLEAMIARFKEQGYFARFPLGSDLTEDEFVIERALLYLQRSNKLKLLFALIGSLFSFKSVADLKQYLLRMKLEKCVNLKELIYRRLLILALRKTSV